MSSFLFPLAGLPASSRVGPDGAATSQRPATSAATHAEFAAVLGLALLPTAKLALAAEAKKGSSPAESLLPGKAGDGTATAEAAATATGEAIEEARMDPTRIGLAVGRALARSAESPTRAVSADQAAESVSAATAEASAKETEEEPTESVSETAEVAESATSASPPENVHRVERARDELDPVFNARLERVIQRMKEEGGHDVRVVETHRSQERQDFLYAQGRSRPGAVVTWTRSSKHTQGRAADLLIDGRYDNAAGYARLARIAAEEGLRTLGARDPGHIELPGRGAALLAASDAVNASLPYAESGARAEAAPRPTRSALPTAPGGIARVAEVARVARVAEVAPVAQVAQVAVPGSARPVASSFASASDRVAGEGVKVVDASSARPAAQHASAPENVPTPAAASAAATLGGGRNERGAEDRPGREPADDKKGEARAESLRAEPLRADVDRTVAAAHVTARPEAVAGREPVASVVGTDALERISQIRELQHEAAGRPVSHVTLQVDAPEGGQDRIRIDLRGNRVETQIDLQDPAAAERLRTRAGELQGALERHGLEPEAVRIRSAADLASLANSAEGELLRTGSIANAGKSQSDSTPQRERGGAKEWEESREDSSRHRSRREQHEGKRK